MEYDDKVSIDMTVSEGVNSNNKKSLMDFEVLLASADNNKLKD